MTAPVASYVQLPTDTANTGKKNRTITKVVGSDTVHEHLVVPSPAFTRNGRFVFQSTGDTVAASSQTGTGSGYYWIQNSTANTGIVMAIRDIRISWGIGGTVVISTASPVVSFSKFTFNNAFTTGTADVAPLSYTTASPTIKVCSTSSGASITLGKPLAAVAIPALVSTVGAYGGHAVLYDSHDPNSLGNCLLLTTGQGLVIYQDQAGVGSDVRKITPRVVWDEVDVT